MNVHIFHVSRRVTLISILEHLLQNLLKIIQEQFIVHLVFHHLLNGFGRHRTCNTTAIQQSPPRVTTRFFLRIAKGLARYQTLIASLILHHVILKIAHQRHVRIQHDGTLLLAVPLVIPLIPVRNSIVAVLHELQFPLGSPVNRIVPASHQHAVVSIVQLVRLRVEDPSVLHALVAESGNLAVRHAHGVHAHDGHRLVRVEAEVLLEVIQHLVRREVRRGHGRIRPADSPPVGAPAILPADVPHRKVIPEWPAVQHAQIRRDQRRQRPDVRARVGGGELLHDGINGLDDLAQSLVVGIVKVDAPVAPADAVVEAQA
mmetsp:Transcript_3057/g.5374  ORF Transcript_3057/g.5374 Transcript_3057/m.5374 type:complete len:316 (-) Transcript_3057:817-1764(-)